MCAEHNTKSNVCLCPLDISATRLLAARFPALPLRLLFILALTLALFQRSRLLASPLALPTRPAPSSANVPSASDQQLHTTHPAPNAPAPRVQPKHTGRTSHKVPPRSRTSRKKKLDHTETQNHPLVITRQPRIHHGHLLYPLPFFRRFCLQLHCRLLLLSLSTSSFGFRSPVVRADCFLSCSSSLRTAGPTRHAAPRSNHERGPTFPSKVHIRLYVANPPRRATVASTPAQFRLLPSCLAFQQRRRSHVSLCSLRLTGWLASPLSPSTAACGHENHEKTSLPHPPRAPNPALLRAPRTHINTATARPPPPPESTAPSPIDSQCQIQSWASS